MNALKRNEKIEVVYFPTEDVFDASILKNKFDIILMWGNQPFGMPKEIFNDLKKTKVAGEKLAISIVKDTASRPKFSKGKSKSKGGKRKRKFNRQK